MPGIPPSTRRSTLLNATLNVFWSILCIAPIFLFCYRFLDQSWLYAPLAVSLCALALPASALRRLQLSSQTRPYRKLRVHLLVRLTQDSGVAQPVCNREAPPSSGLRQRKTLNQMVRTTLARERFHLAAFLFFLSAAASAAWLAHPLWSLLICLCNIAYNLYPIWLQQYIRIRLQRCLRDPRFVPSTRP